MALAAAAAMLLSLAADLTFFQDSWEFLTNRRELSVNALLQPHNEHIVLLPVAIEIALLHLFGMSSAMPEFVVLTALLLATAVLVFVYVRRRLGEWPALMAAVLLLFVGPAWQDLLWPFEIGFVGSVLCGVAMLLALEREDARGDAWACALLVLSLAFSSLGLAFAAAAIVDVAQQRRRRGPRRAWLAAPPLLLYAGWYAGWGHEAEGHVSLHNVLVSPRFVLEAATAATEALVGMSGLTNEPVGQATWGPALLLLLLAALAYGLYRRARRPSPRLWPALAAAATFWFLAAFNFVPGREAWSSRYLYAGAALVLLIVADLLAGSRPSRRALLVAGAVTAVAAASNLVPLRDGHDFLEAQTVLTRADLAAIEIARDRVDPSFGLTPEVAGTPFLIDVSAEEYLEAVDEHGSPAYTPAELAVAPEYGRVQADVVLAAALPVSTETRDRGEAPLGGEVPSGATAAGGVEPNGGGGGGGGARRGDVGSCEVVRPGTGRALALRSGLTTIELPPGPPATIALRRFAAAEFPLVSEDVPGGSTTLLRIPADATSRPWVLRVAATQLARVC